MDGRTLAVGPGAVVATLPKPAELLAGLLLALFLLFAPSLVLANGLFPGMARFLPDTVALPVITKLRKIFATPGVVIVWSL